MKQLMFAITAMLSLGLFADGVVPTKINMLLVDVGSIDTVAKTEKFMAAQDRVSLANPPKPSAAENIVDPDLQKRAVTLNWLSGVAEYFHDRKSVDEENARRRKIIEGLRNSIVGTSENRTMVIAKDYLASGLEDYSEFISIVDRSDASLQEVEKAISNQEQTEVSPATLFLSVTLGDPIKTTKTVPVGDTQVKTTQFTRKATAKVSDFNNVRVFSCDVTATASLRQTSVAATTGNDELIEAKLIEDAMKQIAKKVGERFVKEFTVKVVVPKKLADEIQPEEVELYLDRVVKGDEVVEEGTPVTANEPFRALNANHTVTAVVANEEFRVAQKKVTIGPNKKTATVSVAKVAPAPKALVEE
ncbi:MAG: hypothetical protein MJ109_01405 [Kiritimatiellae bacterium]|nr:hypothetical protein [Kiritimatiellia bacterium]